MLPPFGTDVLHTFEDEAFNRVYPLKVRNQSAAHWTPVQVARKAAQMLVTKPGTRVLDIGCGPGKFCAIGATTTGGCFTGVEQRAHLATVASDMIRSQGIPRVEIIHANITDVRFSDYDAFYIYNPFQENILPSLRIDSRVEMTESLYLRYTEYVEQQLAQAPIGTRVVTYVGECEEIPTCYACDREAFGGYLKLWIKIR
ncbi:MAG: class I SAM-dependent methyltransferase [Prosthecobacter sp.]|nr:class I SAM-dependent methyltransferase [Prosthecobacter sp.]